MLHAGIAGSRLVIVEGAGHTLIWTHSDEFVRVTEEFIAGQRGGRGDGPAHCHVSRSSGEAEAAAETP
jgi:hypothetical protein